MKAVPFTSFQATVSTQSSQENESDPETEAVLIASIRKYAKIYYKTRELILSKFRNCVNWQKTAGDKDISFTLSLYID